MTNKEYALKVQSAQIDFALEIEKVTSDFCIEAAQIREHYLSKDTPTSADIGNFLVQSEAAYKKYKSNVLNITKAHNRKLADYKNNYVFQAPEFRDKLGRVIVEERIDQ